MSKASLYHRPVRFAIIFVLLFLPALTSCTIPSNLTDETDHGFRTAFSFSKISAKSDVDSVILPQHTIGKVNPANLEKTVRDLTSFHTRHTESEFIDDVAYWLIKNLQGICGTEVHVQNFTQSSRNTNDKEVNSNSSQKPSSYNLKNIACENPGLTNNTIIISAHYDSRMEDINNSIARAPGADDNASGVSALLEVARILSNVSLNHSIIFALFSGEEQGKWGSTHYADHIDRTNVDLDLLINLDMVGFSPENTNDFLIEYDNGNTVQDNDRYSLAVANFIKSVALNYTNLNATLGVLGNTDYLPFEALGYTVIGFYDDGVTGNPNHHAVNDTSDTLNYEYLTSTTKLVLASILSLDKLLTPYNPSYVPSFLANIQ
jgi:Peptidase family M28